MGSEVSCQAGLRKAVSMRLATGLRIVCAAGERRTAGVSA